LGSVHYPKDLKESFGRSLVTLDFAQKIKNKIVGDFFMKKKFLIIFSALFLCFPTFAEMSVNLGFGLSPLSFSYLKTDDYKITEDFFFATIPFEFRYFPSKNAKFGFSLNALFMGTPLRLLNEIDYGGDSDYFPVGDDTIVIKDKGYTTDKATVYYGVFSTPALKLQFSPTFNLRNAKNGIFSIGPSYSVLTIESIQRDSIGLFMQYLFVSSREKTFGFDSVGIQFGIDFLEKSDFTDSAWKACFGASLGVSINLGWKFSTILDRKELKQQQELIALQAEKQKKIDEENRIQAEKVAEIERQQEAERIAKQQEEKKQAEILAEQQRNENEKNQQKKKQNAEKILSAFSYDKLPLGKDMQYVLSLCDGADIKENEETDVHFIKDYSLSLLNGSTYSRSLTGLGCYLLGDCTKSYKVTNEYWENLDSITLIFTKSYGKSDYTLMIVVKNQKRSNELSSGKYESVFNAMKNSITKQVGTNPSQFEEDYTNEYFRKCYALCARWQPNGKNLYLFVDNSSIFSESVRGPIIVYTDNAQCQKYMNAEKNYSAERKRKEESNVKMDF